MPDIQVADGEATKRAQRLAEKATEARLHIGADVDELLDQVSTAAFVQRDPKPWDDRPSQWRDPTKDHPPIGPKRLDEPLWVNPSEGHWPSSHRIATSAAGLLTQLEDQHNAVMRAGAGTVGRTAPASRPPDGALDFLAIITEIEAGSLDLWAQARRAMGMRSSLLRVGPQGRYTADPSTRRALRDLVLFAPNLEDRLMIRVGREIRSWVSAAKVTLSYTAPVVTLEQRCWYCGEQTLKVRADASSDLWCANDTWHDEHDEEPRRWPQATWLMMLAEGHA